MKETDLFQHISTVSEAKGIPIFVVGGYVRDHLLLKVHGKNIRAISTHEPSRVLEALQKDALAFVQDIEPEKEKITNKKATKIDIDFVVDGSGIAFALAFDEHMKEEGSLVVFEDFDTARYVLDNMEIEFAGARSETYDTASRKP